MSVVGIDLGTTNTVVGCVRTGKVHVLADGKGVRLLPSVVSFHPNGEVLVGTSAKARRVIDARNTVYSHKRLIGRSWNSPEIAQARKRCAFELREGPGQGPLVHARGQDYTLPEISAFVLKRARQIAETALSTPVDRAVITVPAHFNELQRASTKVAGRVSGLEVLRILNEPTAAALAYGLGRAGNERVAVYDFGGGTFDCTLLDLNGNVFEVLATAGDSFLGGDDVDNLIADRMAETFLKQYRQDPRLDPQTYERLKTTAEEVKIALSSAESHTVILRDIGHGAGGASLIFHFSMTRKDLDALIGPLVDQSFKVTQDALALARLSPSSFDKVILVGGSTRIPIVRRRVENFFGSQPMDRVNPEEVVAIGAAIQAAALTEGIRRRSIPAPPGAAKRPSQGDTQDNTQTSQMDSANLKPAFASGPPGFNFSSSVIDQAGPATAQGNPPPPPNAPNARTQASAGLRKETTPGVAPGPSSRQGMAAIRPASSARMPAAAVRPAPTTQLSGSAQAKAPVAAPPTVEDDDPGFGAIDDPPSMHSTTGTANLPSFPTMTAPLQPKEPIPLASSKPMPLVRPGSEGEIPFGALAGSEPHLHHGHELHRRHESARRVRSRVGSFAHRAGHRNRSDGGGARRGRLGPDGLRRGDRKEGAHRRDARGRLREQRHSERAPEPERLPRPPPRSDRPACRREQGKAGAKARGGATDDAADADGHEAAAAAHAASVQAGRSEAAAAEPDGDDGEVTGEAAAVTGRDRGDARRPPSGTGAAPSPSDDDDGTVRFAVEPAGEAAVCIRVGAAAAAIALLAVAAAAATVLVRIGTAPVASPLLHNKVAARRHRSSDSTRTRRIPRNSSRSNADPSSRTRRSRRDRARRRALRSSST